MSTTNCYRNMHNGVLDMGYLEHRLDSIEARIDDLCGLLGEVLERLGVDTVSTTEVPTGAKGIELRDEPYSGNGQGWDA